MVKTPSWPVLKINSVGKNVQAVQELLTYHKYSVPVNGRFDTATQQAVSTFQRRNSIKPEPSYGVVGENTLSELIVVSTNGANNNAVRAAQTLLKKFEKELPINGFFDTLFFNTLVTFQETMGIKPTAAVDYSTWQYLFGYSSYQPTASVGVTSKLSEKQMYINAKYICTYLQNKGFSKNAACGILGNMHAETSKIDPGLWEKGHLDDPRGGYGLVQWTNGEYKVNKIPNPFLLYAAEIGLISDSRACSELDALALSNPKKLMNAELDWLIKSMGDRDYFYFDDRWNNWDKKVEESKMNFTKFKTSTKPAYDLAIAFHDFYERSGDNLDQIQKNRATPAQNYFDTGLFD